MISANSLSAAVQGQFMFVLPWMLLARGSSPQTAALATACIYVPMLLTAVPAGAKSDNADPLRLMRWVTAVPLVACAVYPLAALAGRDWFVLVLVAAVVVGTTRNLSEGAVFRSLADTTRDEGLLRAHAIRTTVNQAALFGSGFIGLVLFRVGDAEAVMVGICLLYAAALAILAVVPELGRVPDPDTLARHLVTEGLTSLLRNRLLRRIGWVTLMWSMFGGAAVGLMPAVLREHIGMDELQASATFAAGAVAVVLLTLPLVRASQRRLRRHLDLRRGECRAGDDHRPLRRHAGRAHRAAPLLRLPPREQRGRGVAWRCACSRGRSRPPGDAQPRRGDARAGGFRRRGAARGRTARPARLRRRPRARRRGDDDDGARVPSIARNRVTVLDLLIRGATVYPGDALCFHGDVGVDDRGIALVVRRIDEASPLEAHEVVGGDGLVLCPGFIDLHAHSALQSFDDPFLTPKLAQGFTTEVINPDGLAPAPVAPHGRAGRQAYLRPLEGPGPETWPWSTVAEYLEALDATRPALSLVPSIGHGAVRDLVLGGGRAAPSERTCARCAAR